MMRPAIKYGLLGTICLSIISGLGVILYKYFYDDYSLAHIIRSVGFIAKEIVFILFMFLSVRSYKMNFSEKITFWKAFQVACLTCLFMVVFESILVMLTAAIFSDDSPIDLMVFVYLGMYVRKFLIGLAIAAIIAFFIKSKN